MPTPAVFPSTNSKATREEAYSVRIAQQDKLTVAVACLETMLPTRIQLLGKPTRVTHLDSVRILICEGL